MKERIQRYFPWVTALILAMFCGCFLLMYVSPMKDVSLDLSVRSPDSLDYDPEQYDSKGWSVYTRQGDAAAELIPNGYGGYTGLELGQTFYFSRIMDEELDDPTLQLDANENRYAVWLDDALIYTDCPELDNRIGHLHLPMNEWLRDNPITISLPADYYGKTLTIAQSFPEWTETGSVTAWPASVRLYCGFAYESSLISETAKTMLLAVLAFLLTLTLLAGFALSRDWGILCLSLVAFHWMTQRLVGTSFYFRYFISTTNMWQAALPMISTLGLLCYLTLRGGTRRKLLWVPVIGYALCVGCDLISLAVFPKFTSIFSFMVFLTNGLPSWLALSGLVTVLVMGSLWWRKENMFYRFFIPLAFLGIAISWTVQIFFVNRGFVLEQIAAGLAGGDISYVYSHTQSGITIAALLTAAAEMIRTELNRHVEKRLVEQRRELTMAGYENLRRQHEEVMMLRHDMLRHLNILHDMGGDERRTAYLTELIGQNQRIRPIVESGNEMLDIILNGKLGAAVDAGIRVDIQRAEAPPMLPLSGPDLCALVMNIVDNAVKAAKTADAPYIRMNIHEKDGYLVISCENSSAAPYVESPEKNEAMPKHGLGLKIIRNITERSEGTMLIEHDPDHVTVRVVLPLT